MQLRLNLSSTRSYRADLLYLPVARPALQGASGCAVGTFIHDQGIAKRAH